MFASDLGSPGGNFSSYWWPVIELSEHWFRALDRPVLIATMPERKSTDLDVRRASCVPIK